MKRHSFFLFLCWLTACKEPPVFGAEGSQKKVSAVEVSQERTKKLNESERQLIEEWISHQPEKFYPTSMNYWIDVPDFNERKAYAEGTVLDYQYFLYDFSGQVIYEQPFRKDGVEIGKFNDLTAVQDAVNYLKPGEEATLLVPSTLAYGTYGDNDRIQNDVPLVIKLKLKNAIPTEPG